jgi:hypothetical protein
MQQPRKKRDVMIDEPTPFDTLATWERHLSDLKRLPADTELKPEMIRTAEQSIARKKAEESRQMA